MSSDCEQVEKMREVFKQHLISLTNSFEKDSGTFRVLLGKTPNILRCFDLSKKEVFGDATAYSQEKPNREELNVNDLAEILRKHYKAKNVCIDSVGLGYGKEQVVGWGGILNLRLTVEKEGSE